MATKPSSAKASGNDDVARLKARVQELEEALRERQEAASVAPPIVIDLGKTRRKHVKALKRGKGKLVDEVLDVINLVREDLGEEAAGRALVPVVVLYRRRNRKRNRTSMLFPF